MRRISAAGLTAILLIAAMPVPAADAPPRLSAGEILRGRFVQERHLAGFDAPLRTGGRFVLVPGRGLIWSAETPFAIVTVITPSALVQRTENAEVMRLSAARMPLLGQLYKLLGGALVGDWRALSKVYEVKRTQDGEKWRVTLRPKKSGGPAQPFDLVNVSGNRFVGQIELHKSGGDIDRLNFSGQARSSGPPTPDETALFDGAK